MFLDDKKTDPLMILHHSSSLPELNHNFKTICDNYFIETFSIAKLLQINQNNTIEYDCYHNYPSEWVDYYQKKKYYLNDPVLSHTQSIQTPHYWNINKFADISTDQENILKEGCDFGIKRGTTIALLPHNKCVGYLTLVDTNIHHPEALCVLSKAAEIYINTKHDLDQKQAFRTLTNKEISVLALKAEGYMIKQISDDLQISDATVIFHLKNIRAKLGVITTEQAVFKYIATTN
jgi:DNA-binding CsgD family transcriptional regulator